MRELPKKAVSVPEAAQMLSVSTRTMWRLVHRGEIRSVLVASRRLVPIVAIDEFLERGVA